MPPLGARLSDSRALGGLIAVATVAVLVQGCASGSVRNADLRTPAAYEAVQPAETAPAEALDHWWALYDDAQLTGLVEEALRNSPDSKDAFSKLQQAIEVRRSALYSYNPQGNLSASSTRPVSWASS